MTETDAQIIAAAIGLVGVLLTVGASITAVLIRRSLDERTREQQKIDTVIAAVRLLSTDGGADAPGPQKAGALLALGKLGQTEFSLALLGRLWPGGEVETREAVLLIDQALRSGDRHLQDLGAHYLAEYAGLLPRMPEGVLEWPSALRPSSWEPHLPSEATSLAIDALHRALASQDNWSGAQIRDSMAIQYHVLSSGVGADERSRSVAILGLEVLVRLGRYDIPTHAGGMIPFDDLQQLVRGRAESARKAVGELDRHEIDRLSVALTTDRGIVVGSGTISGETFHRRAVQYEIIHDLALFEGDIVLDRVERPTPGRPPKMLDDVRVSRRWADGIVPYEIEPTLPGQQRVRDAIGHWEAMTTLRFVARRHDGDFANYIYFTPASGCWSYVGCQHGRQDVGVANACSTGNVIHEIGHAVGLWHENSREDRDEYLTIHWDNVIPEKSHVLNQYISDGDDVGRYDYSSVMHLGAYAFSRNGQPTLSPKASDMAIGQRKGLSAGDVAAVEAIYTLTKRE